MNRLPIATALLLMTWVAQAQPLEFKGLPFGASSAEFAAAHPGFDCYKQRRCTQVGPRRVSAPTYFEPLTYAGETVSMIDADFGDDKLDRIGVMFNPRSYEPIGAALESKYGKPSKVIESEFRTKGGLVAVQQEKTWDLGDGATITLRRYAGSITDGSLNMYTASYLERFNRERAEQAQKARKDI